MYRFKRGNEHESARQHLTDVDCCGGCDAGWLVHWSAIGFSGLPVTTQRSPSFAASG
jgi:hypothetical protein